MRKLFYVLAITGSLLGYNILYAQPESGNDLTKYVNPLIGTDSDVDFSSGNTYPAIALPWGMNFWTPVTVGYKDVSTRWFYKSIYRYDEHKIKGFRLTHQPSPWIRDYGNIQVMPITGRLQHKPEDRESWFSHQTETAGPDYYKVYLGDYGVTTEITPTERCAQFRFTFPQTDSAYVLLDLYDTLAYTKILPDEQKVIGYAHHVAEGTPKNLKIYFVAYFDKKFDSTYTWNGDELLRKEETSGNWIGPVLKFKTRRDEKVCMKIGASFISLEQAEINLNREVGSDSFDQTRKKASSVWNKALGKVQVEGGSDDQKKVFYSAMYHSLLFPRKFFESDANGQIMHYSPYNEKVLPGYMFTDNGFWDTFRAEFPLLTILFPELNSQIMQGLVNTYLESGWLPEWASPDHRNCMIGSNSASIIADSYLKGIRGYDIKILMEAILKNSENEGPLNSLGRYGVKYYNSLGYVPYDVKITENTARTLEYSYDDFCIRRLTEKLNYPANLVDTFRTRSQYYRNVFDTSTNLMRGRNLDGTFQSPFNPFKWGDAFTEGCSWHYTWSVFHDPQGLMDLMGGKESFTAMLDSIFILPPYFDYSYYGVQLHEINEMLVANMGQYAHGNQPMQHVPYLYCYAGQPWKTQMHVRKIMDQLYTSGADGLCGDEDNGQTSAWYVFSAMGFYPVCPGSGQYVMGSPIFNKITLHLDNGNRFIIEAKGNSPDNVYIQRATLNGKEYTANFILHETITKGGTLKFEMSDHPDFSRGIKDKDFPYSVSKGD